MHVDHSLTVSHLLPKLEHLFELSAQKILSIEDTWDPGQGTPVFTIQGRYTTRGWTEWTQGFQFGSAVLQYDATEDAEFLEIGRVNTVAVMAPHVTHVGVHDHGFNNVSTYGNLRRLMREGCIPENPWEMHFYEIALKASGAVQADRWSPIKDDLGYIYSFNGPHSLFSDTIRSLRALGVAHQLGHVLMGEGDQPISLLKRLIQHSEATAKYNVYYGEGRDSYDVRGRVVHESIFNMNDGNYRCPSTQQGYSPFSTWTRGLAWILTGYAEQLEFFETLDDAELAPFGGRDAVTEHMLKAALAVSDFYIENTSLDGIPYWDTGAPGLMALDQWRDALANPYNEYEPVDSSAAAIASQGLVRLGNYLRTRGEQQVGTRYYQAGLTVMNTLLSEPYLSEDPAHQGLLLHSVYHRPNGWDYIPEGHKVPNGESSMWGDYHMREASLLLLREAQGKPYLAFFT